MALPINIDKLFDQNTVESERKEFKLGLQPVSCMHTVCAFANDFNNWGGGYIILGVASQNGVPVRPVTGIRLNRLDTLQRKVTELTHKIITKPTVVMSPEMLDGKHLLVIWTPGGDNRPYKAPENLAGGRRPYYHYIREGSITRRATTTEEQKLFELAAKIPFDDRINHHATIDDLELTHIQAFLKEVSSPLLEESRGSNLIEVCRKMHIVKGAQEDPRPINVGLLLFNSEPHNFFRGASIEIIQHQDQSGDSFSENKLTGPIHTQLRDALSFIRNNVIQEKVQKIHDLEEADRVVNYPYAAVEESLANAVFHRSYEHQNSIEVNVRPDRIEFLSFPGPLPPLDNAMLQREVIVPRDYRNRRIGDFLKELSLTEGRGTGIPKIRKSMELNGSPVPKFETDKDSTYFLTTLPIHQSFIDLKLDDYMKSILSFCEEPKSRREALEYIGLTNHGDNYSRHISPLIASGYLTCTLPHIPKSPKQRYVTTPQGNKALKTTN